MNFVKKSFLILIFSFIVCNGMRPLCSLPENKEQLLGMGFFISGISSIFGSIPQFMKICFLYGESSADSKVIKKQIFKNASMILAVGISSTITGFLMLGCNFKSKMARRERIFS